VIRIEIPAGSDAVRILVGVVGERTLDRQRRRQCQDGVHLENNSGRSCKTSFGVIGTKISVIDADICRIDANICVIDANFCVIGANICKIDANICVIDANICRYLHN